MKPPVSVVIPCHGHVAFLRQACDSVLAEGIGAEILVVDDGDPSRPLESVRDLNVVGLRSPRRLGVAGARNLGAATASADLLAFLDADDRLVPGGLRWRLEYLGTYPAEEAVAGTGRFTLDPCGRVIAGGNLFGAEPELPDRLSIAWAKRRAIQTAAWTFAVRTAVFREVGGFDESLIRDPDTDLFHKLIARRPMPYFPLPVVDYRVHTGNNTAPGPGFAQSRHTTAETWLTHLAWSRR